MGIGIGYYSEADLFISLRAANHQEDIVWTTAQQDTYGGLVVTPRGELATPETGVYGGVCVYKFVPEGKPLPYVPQGPVENDDWTQPFGVTQLPFSSVTSVDQKCFLAPGGKLVLTPPTATYLMHIGDIKNETLLNVNFPLKVKLF